jgi:hypothetical protein
MRREEPGKVAVNNPRRMTMRMREYLRARLCLSSTSQETAPDEFSSAVSDAGSSSKGRNTGAAAKATVIGRVFAEIREIFWLLSA